MISSYNNQKNPKFFCLFCHFQICTTERICSKIWTGSQWNCIWLSASLKQSLKLVVKHTECLVFVGLSFGCLFLKAWLSCNMSCTSFSRIGWKVWQVSSHALFSPSPSQTFSYCLRLWLNKEVQRSMTKSITHTQLKQIQDIWWRTLS